MSAVCPHFSAVCLHFSALLWTVRICPHLSAFFICTCLHCKKNISCQIIHTESSANLNRLKISHSLARSEVHYNVQYNTIQSLFHGAGLGAVRIYCPHLSTFLWTVRICPHCVCMCPHCVHIVSTR